MATAIVVSGPDQLAASIAIMMIDAKLCLGCMSFGTSQWRPWVLDRPAAFPLLEAAAAAGITAFDTANVYSGGESERILGEFIGAHGMRDRTFIATKLYYDTPDRLGLKGLGRDNVIGSTDASLKRLGVECIDLMQIHSWDDATPIEETLEAFAELIDQGCIRAIGASNLSAWQLAKAQIAAAKLGLPGFSAVQPHYNLIYREEERDLIPLCRDQGIALLPWSPLARGRLARGAAKSARAASDDVAESLYGDSGEQIIAAVQQISEQRMLPPAAIALAWLIANGTTPIFGATRPEQIREAVIALTVQLTDEEVALIERPYVALPLTGLPAVARNQTPTAELAGLLRS
jgi:aryl-alcohol dehydrogenase-like predicted oxidoreductase